MASMEFPTEHNSSEAHRGGIVKIEYLSLSLVAGTDISKDSTLFWRCTFTLAVFQDCLKLFLKVKKDLTKDFAGFNAHEVKKTKVLHNRFKSGWIKVNHLTLCFVILMT